MDDTPASSAGDEADGPSRRWFLLGGGVLVVAGGATGSVVRLARETGDDPPAPNPAPAGLSAAVAREQALIADLDATTGGSAVVRAVLLRARADHAAHLAALDQLLRDYDPPSATATASTSAAAGTPRTVAQLRAAEIRAAGALVAEAERTSGRVATLLVSIAACEASHAAVLQ